MKTKKDVFAFWSYILIAALVVANTVWMMAGISGPLASRGAAALKYFTVLSNILMGASMALVFPYTLDGLRKHNFHLPRCFGDLIFD